MAVGFKIVHGFKLDALAAVDGIEALLGGGAQPFKLRFVFLLVLLKEPQSFAHYFARILHDGRDLQRHLPEDYRRMDAGD